MKELPGISLTEFPFKNIFKIGDLVYFDGPLLSVFSNDKGEIYLFDWSDNDDKYNRWLVFRISLTQLIQYLNKNISHYQLITTYFTDFIVSVDIDNDLNYYNVLLLNVADIPNDYLPDRDVTHIDEESPHLDKINAYVNQLELKAAADKQRQWQKKFKISMTYEELLMNSNKISKREQILAVY